MNHIMLDLETFGTGRDAAIVSIGACLFDPVKGIVPEANYVEADVGGHKVYPTFHQKIDLEGSSDVFGKITPATVAWWLKQSNEARQALLIGERVSLPIALTKFDDWLFSNFAGAHLCRHDTQVRLWANGPTFDVDILMDAYERCRKTFPVHFRTFRDCRTALDMALEAGWTKLKQPGQAHDALADSLFQSRAVCAIYKHMGINEGGCMKTADLPESRNARVLAQEDRDAVR